jgi:hypothetical protein
MKIFIPWYLKITRKNFTRAFKPIERRKKSSFFVCAPVALKDFVSSLPFLENLHGLGSIVLFLPRSFEVFTRHIRPGLFEFVFFDKVPVLLTREFKAWQERFREASYESLIDINTPANIHLPYLVRAEKRFAFYDPKIYPYYNILIKGGLKTLEDFFRFGKTNLKKTFHITETETHKLDKKLGKKHPLLFVAGPDDRPWEGDKFVLGRDYLPDMDLVKIIYLCDAYYGPDDEWREVARLFDKPILV